MINITIDIDKNPDGTPRITRNGEYRFSLLVRDSDDVTHAILKGFRYNPRVRRITPPATPIPGGGSYTLAEVSKELEDHLMQGLVDLPETTGYGVSLKVVPK